MYPRSELIRLAAYKTSLRGRIATRRAQCATAAACVTRPLAWIDRLMAFGRRLAPLASVPLGRLVARVVFPRQNIIGSLLRSAPLVATAAWMLRGAFSGSSGRTDPHP